MKHTLPKIIVVVGPTASGKSDLSVALAQKYNGEVISADSRQVYKGLDIGSGKITKKEMEGIPHYMLDVVSPQKVYTVQHFKKDAEKAISIILKKGKVPIICGGTGFYIQSVVDNFFLPEVPPNEQLRKQLRTKTTRELSLLLKALDFKRWNTIDTKNPVRLVRAIEIAKTLGKIPALHSTPHYQSLQIGIKTDDTTLKERIVKRLHGRIKKGMIKEVEHLHAKGVSWKRLESLGLEYRYVALYLQKKLSKEEMIKKLTSEIWHYAKRQKTWFKKDTRIKWVTLKEQKKIEKELTNFLK